MDMKTVWVIPVCLIFLSFPSIVKAQDATPQELIAKVKQAAELVKNKGEASFPDFDDPNGPWVFGGTYVFIMKCDETKLATHPIKPKLIGRDLSTIKDKFGNYFFSQMCEASKNPKGGWTEYYWPKPGEKQQSRKISFTIPIPGTPYQAGAGLYDDTISVEELKRLN